MKLNELNTFFDNISPTSEQKERMLANILNYHEGEKEVKKTARKISMAAIIAAALVLMATGVFAAGGGGFDWLIQRFNPSLGELAAKVEASCVDQDIRMEVIGANAFDNVAVIYISLQDLSGQNRITERSGFRGTLDVKDTTPEDWHGGTGTSADLLYFDEETNTVYREITLQSDWPFAAPLEISGSRIYFDETNYDDAAINFDLSAVAETEGIDVPESQISSWRPIELDNGRDMLSKMLEIGDLRGALPHEDPRQFISNAGFIDGWLHIQIKSVYEDFGVSSPTLYLRAPDGTDIQSYNVSYVADKNGDILEDGGTDENTAYSYDNIAFPVGDVSSLGGYSLRYYGGVSSGIRGDWAVTADTGDVTKQLRIFTDALSLNGTTFEHTSLSPMGMSARGSYLKDSTHDFNPKLEVILETDAGEINLGTGSGVVMPPAQTFSYFWEVEEPLDVSSVKAIRVNGVYMDLE